MKTFKIVSIIFFTIIWIIISFKVFNFSFEMLNSKDDIENIVGILFPSAYILFWIWIVKQIIKSFSKQNKF